jgi:hypothetical protein
MLLKKEIAVAGKVVNSPHKFSFGSLNSLCFVVLLLGEKNVILVVKDF